MRAVCKVARQNPQAMAATPSAIGNPTGRRRATMATAIVAIVSAHCSPPGRLAVRGEIERDAGAEGDRQPWQQPPRRGLGRNPFGNTGGAGSRRVRPIRPAAAPQRGGGRRQRRRPTLLFGFPAGLRLPTAPRPAQPEVMLAQPAVADRGTVVNAALSPPLCPWPGPWRRCRAGRRCG